MSGKQIIEGPGGRRLIAEPGEPMRVALPMHIIDDACDPAEKDLLLRFTEASEMAKGNMAVAVLNGSPRGRYSLYADRVSVERYAKFEIDAYRWILTKYLGKALATNAEIVVRLNGERLETMDAHRWGEEIANTDDPAVALGAVIGSTRALAWSLRDAYRAYYVEGAKKQAIDSRVKHAIDAHVHKIAG